MSTVHKWFLGRCLIVLAFLAGAGPVASRAADSFSADLVGLYYTDGANRTLNWDLTGGTADEHGVVTIPSSAYTLPLAETGAVLTLEPDGGLTTKVYSSGAYHMAVPPATPGMAAIPTAAAEMTIDGSPSDWGSIATFIQDQTGDVWWAGVPTGADVESVQLAYSPDQSKLYFLYKLTENANPGLWYRLFLNKRLQEDESGSTALFQIDLQYSSGQWHVVTQGWHSDTDGDWYILTNDNGVVAVSGQYLEAQVDTAPLGLPARVAVFGRSMAGASPYTSLDRFRTNFKETAGAVYLNGDEHITVPASSTYTAAARVQNFANWAIEGNCPYLRYAGVVLSCAGEDEAFVTPYAEAFWITGDFDGTEASDALVILARIEKWSEGGSYSWDWEPGTGGGLIVPGLDPSTTTVDLKIAVTNSGQTVTFYYRTNSTSALSTGTWVKAIDKTLPAGTGTMYGAPTTSPHVELETGFNRAAPVYRFWNKIFSRHVYTMSRTEKAKLLALPYFLTYEGIQYYTFSEDSQPGTLPIYRFWSNSLSAHFYTISEGEKNKLITKFSNVWTYEGPVFYAYPAGSQPDGAVAVYRFWSNTLNCHFYTTSTAERDKLISKFSAVWAYEGPAFYTLPSLFGND